MSNLRHTVHHALFISEADTSTIRDAALNILQSDAFSSVPNAYIEAVLQYLDERGHLDIAALNLEAACRRAEVATHLKRR